jgi:NADH:ubiquinone oxidoreductase subunit 4 (subunit M)
MFFGEITNEKNKLLPDLSIREWAYMLPLVVMSLWIGMYPAPFIRFIEKPVNSVVKQIKPNYPIPGQPASTTTITTSPTIRSTSGPVQIQPPQE